MSIKKYLRISQCSVSKILVKNKDNISCLLFQHRHELTRKAGRTVFCNQSHPKYLSPSTPGGLSVHFRSLKTSMSDLRQKCVKLSQGRRPEISKYDLRWPGLTEVPNLDESWQILKVWKVVQMMIYFYYDQSWRKFWILSF